MGCRVGFLKRFPSHDQLIKNAWGSASRFPLALLSAIIATTISMYLVEHESLASEAFPLNLMVVAALGIPLFIVLTVFSERRKLTKTGTIILQAVGVVLLAAYYFTLPAGFIEQPQQSIRFTVLTVALHFLVAFLPFIGKDQITEFWQYNKTLFLRFLISALYSAVMFIGLFIALAAADKLFAMEIKYERYFQLWIFLVGIFNTWCFLSGIPERDEQLDQHVAFPRGLKVFVQFVLLPLVGVYSAILFAYELKIIIEWNLPKGWVSQLVLWYAVVGILSMLLLYPLRQLTENRWIQRYITWFFRGMVPLLVMLFVAIIRRISDYGITEARYYVLAMSVGLTIVCVYFIVSRIKDIRIIPMVLFVIGIVSAFGPWSASDISLRSQQGRLDEMLTEYQLAGKTADNSLHAEISFEDQREMSNIVRYLNEFHGARAFDKWLSDEKVDTLTTLARWDRAGRAAGMLGFESISSYAQEGMPESFGYTAEENVDIDLKGFDKLYVCQITQKDLPSEFLSEGDYSCWFILRQDSLEVLLGAVYEDAEVLSVDLSSAIKSLAKTHGYEYVTVSPQEMTYDFESDAYSAEVMLRSLQGFKENDSLNITNVEMQVLVGKK